MGVGGGEGANALADPRPALTLRGGAPAIPRRSGSRERATAETNWAQCVSFLL